MKPYDHVPIAYLGSMFSSWKRILSAGEIGHVFFLPREDIAYRAHQLRDWAIKQHIPLTLLDMNADLLEDEGALGQKLASLAQPAVIIARSAFLTNPDAPRLAHIIQHAWFTSSKGILIFHEGFPSQFDPIFARMPTTFHQHTHIFPLYPKDAIDGYIKTLTADWGMTVKQHQKDAIFEVCGGNIWLATDILRTLRTFPHQTILDCLNTESFQKKMRIFWESLPPVHRACLTYGPKNDAASKIAHKELEKFGFFKLPGYLETLIEQKKRQAFAIEAARVTFRGDDITTLFSRGERRILALFYATPGEPVGRDALGEAFWQKEAPEKHSDWALDKLMSRLRTKIIKTQLPCSIDTVRGKGYVYRRSD